MDNNIHFEKINHKYQDIIFSWLAEPHMQEFWDNSQEHKNDIINFINGRVAPSNYFNGIFTYWIGIIDDEPFCFILTGEVIQDEEYPQIWKDHISKTGTTYSIDFGIGNKNLIGKGLAAPALRTFVEFFKSKIDPKADTFFIDPGSNNLRAKHVYTKAGFNLVGDFDNPIAYWDFDSQRSHLMVKKL